jgi:hypothetical protein
MLRFLNKLFLPFSFFIVVFANAQVKFTATVPNAQIGKDELLQLRLVVENAETIEEINAPSFLNFTVVSGPNQESGMSNVNGAISRYVALNYILKPTRPGTFTIPPASAKADGKKINSNSVTVKITNAAGVTSSNANPFAGINPFDDMPVQQPSNFNDFILKKGENTAEKVSRNLFIKLSVDKTTCYVGQPIVATYKLYTRLKSESNVIKNPSFAGLSVVDMQLQNDLIARREVVNGREYNVYEVRKVQLYPLEAGKIELEPLQIENNVQFIKEAYAAKARNIYGEFTDAAIPPEGLDVQKITLQSKPTFITVNALPTNNIPNTFKGAVGNFNIKAILDKNNFTTDDAGKLLLTLQGEGNMQLMTAPDVNWPSNIEAFEPKTTDEIEKTTVPISGSKVLVWNFIASKPGLYEIPAIVFTYFNSATGKYKTDTTSSLKFTVLKGSGKKNIMVIGKNENKNLFNKFFSNRRYVASTIATLIALGLLFYFKRDKYKEEKATKEAAAIAAATPVTEAAQIILPPDAYLEKANAMLQFGNVNFYQELNMSLRNYLADRLQLPAATLNKKLITDKLNSRQVSSEAIIKVQTLLNDIELQLYTPFEDKEQMQQLYNVTADAMRLLESYKI